MTFKLMLIAVSAVLSTDAGMFAALRDADLRLATIAWRLATTNAALCDRLAPTPGLAIHAIGQYDPALRTQARAEFGFETPVAVEGVVAGSAAARAGVLQNDGLIAVNGEPFASEASSRADGAGRDAAAALLARQPAGRSLALSLARGGELVDVMVAASPGCRSAFEVLLGSKMEASSDGTIVQIGVRFFERYDDEQVAVVVAHELAHTILRHRERLEAAGVKRGLLAEVGRNGRLFRRTESEADMLGMHLLRNAGYDPHVAVRFWRDHGGDVDGGLFRSRTHPSSKARAAAIEAAIAALPTDAPRPYRPPMLATRDMPLD
jgi:hypothetical protein